MPDGQSVVERNQGLPEKRRMVVEPPGRLGYLDLNEMWQYRELFLFLVWRDIKVRYKQTFFGAAWALVQPLTILIIFTIVFGRLANVSSQGLPYPLFAFAALIPWTLFSQGLAMASNSLIVNVNLVAKIYFPRLLIPLAAASSFLVDALIALVIVGGMMIYYGVMPGLTLLLVPVFLLFALFVCLAFGIWFSALNVTYRDVRYVVPLMLQVLLYASPIGYSTAELDGTFKWLISINPMTGVVEGFRWALLGTSADLGQILPLSILGALLIFIPGLLYFLHAEQTFADVV